MSLVLEIMIAVAVGLSVDAGYKPAEVEPEVMNLIEMEVA